MTVRHKEGRPKAPGGKLHFRIQEGRNVSTDLRAPITRKQWTEALRLITYWRPIKAWGLSADLPAPITCKQWTEAVRLLTSCGPIEAWDNAELPPEIDPLSWQALAWKITNGDPPRAETIAARLVYNTDPMPAVVRAYVADLLAGKVKQRRGRRRDTLRYQMERAMRASIVDRVMRLVMRLKRRGVADGYHVALEHVAARTGFSEHTLDSWIYPRQR